MRIRLLPHGGGRAASDVNFWASVARYSQAYLTVALVLALLLALRAGAAGAAQELGLKWQPTNAAQTLGVFIEQQLVLSTNQPASIKKAPPGISAPIYGELKIGPREKRGARPVLIDEPVGAPARFFIDGNGNGDLTDDPAVTWTHKTMPQSNGRTMSVYQGSGNVKIPFTSGDRDGRIGFARLEGASDGDKQAKHVLFYSRDYLLQGQLLLGDKTYQAALVDEFVTGDFRGEDSPRFSGVGLFMDLNGDGRFDLQREFLDV